MFSHWQSNMSKSVITILICLLLCQLRANVAVKIVGIEKECAEKNGIDINIAENLDDDDKLFENKKYRCYLKCIYFKGNLIDKEGMINREAMKNKFYMIDNFNTILDKCNGESMKFEDTCDKVFKLQSCILQETEDKADFRRISENCAKELGIDIKVLDRLGDEEIFKKKSNKCLLKCIFTKMGYMDKHGKINRDLWENYGFIKNIKGVVNNCMVQHDGETDSCEKIYKFSNCVDYSKNN